jgi:predicted amidohydrolase
MMKQLILVAAVQHSSEPGKIRENLASAGKYILMAAKRNAQLVVLPELFATGYCPNSNIFKFGETEEKSLSLRWMEDMAKTYGIYLGGGVPIYENGNLYNRFYLFSPAGKNCGYAQKQFGESYCFKRDEGIFCIETDIGKIGVSICADSHFSSVIKKLQDSDIDILLMPHAWPTPETNNQDETEFAVEISRLLKVPVVYVNGIGRMESMQGLMGKLMSSDKFKLRGKSCIVNVVGMMVKKLGDEPDVIVGNVKLGKVSNDKAVVPNYYGWVHPGSWVLRKIIIPIDIRRGKKIYRKNIKSRNALV